MAEKTKPESVNAIVAALKYVFGPLAQKSDRLPAPLAIGLPILVTVLLIAVLKSQLSTNIAWLVGLAIVLPMAGYIIQLILARTVPTAPKVEIHAQPWAEIDSPKKGGTPLDRTIKCTGSATAIPADMHLWLAVEEDRRGQRFIWPKEGEVFVDKQGKWKHQIFEHGVAPKVSISLWMTNPVADAFIRAWLETGKQTGVYSEIKGIPGANRLTSVDGLPLKPKKV